MRSVLLSAEAPFGQKYQRVNPDYKSGKPKVFIEHLKANPDTSYDAGDFSESSRSIVREHGSEILHQFSTNHTTRWGVISSTDKTTTKLRSQGWAVLNPAPPKNRYVYVVELDSAISELSRVRKINPDADPDLECLYVGQTSLDPNERLEQHKRGTKASPYVKNYGLHLNMKFLRLPNPVTELESMREENSLASYLRSRGHTVVGGH